MSDDLIDQYDDEELGLEGDDQEASIQAELTEAEAEQAEAQAQAEATAQADELIRKFEGFDSDEPQSWGSDDQVRAWTRYMEEHLAQRQSEREQVEAVFAADEAAAAGETDGAEEPQRIDFTKWDSDSFADLFDRVTGAKPIDAPRGVDGDDEFERGMLRLRRFASGTDNDGDNEWLEAHDQVMGLVRDAYGVPGWHAGPDGVSGLRVQRG
jgi:hypothetical protein